jgi:hypothetical protein
MFLTATETRGCRTLCAVCKACVFFLRGRTDGDGNRLEKSSGTLFWYGAGTEILDESNLSGTFTNEYVFFGGKRVAMRDVSTGNIYY